jgi:hypothetical protein
MKQETISSNISATPRHGVITLFGYGIKVYVDRGHLILEDGIGADRLYARLPRVGHGLRRLVVIGADGYVSLAALRWLADQDAAFVMLERDGLCSLRRAQFDLLMLGYAVLRLSHCNREPHCGSCGN